MSRRVDVPEWRRYVSDAALVLLAIVVTITVVLVVQRDPEPDRTVEQPVPSAATDSADRARAFADSIETVLVIGDGTARVGGSEPAWPERLATSRDWKLTNLARVGTGFNVALTGEVCPADQCPSFLGSIVTAVEQQLDPDLIVVSGGGWDGLQPAATRRAAVATFFSALRATFKRAGIIALSPMWLDEPLPAPLDAVQDAVGEDATRVGGAYLEVGDPFRGIAEGEDPGTFNDRANETVSSAIDLYLRELGITDD